MKMVRGKGFSKEKPFAVIGKDGGGYFVMNVMEISRVRVNATPDNLSCVITMRDGFIFDLDKYEDDEEVSMFLNWFTENCASYSGFDKPEYIREVNNEPGR